MSFEHMLVEKAATVVNEATPGIQGYGETMEDLGVSISNTLVYSNEYILYLFPLTLIVFHNQTLWYNLP